MKLKLKIMELTDMLEVKKLEDLDTELPNFERDFVKVDEL